MNERAVNNVGGCELLMKKIIVDERQGAMGKEGGGGKSGRERGEKTEGRGGRFGRR